MLPEIDFQKDPKKVKDAVRGAYDAADAIIQLSESDEDDVVDPREVAAKNAAERQARGEN